MKIELYRKTKQNKREEKDNYLKSIKQKLQLIFFVLFVG